MWPPIISAKKDPLFLVEGDREWSQVSKDMVDGDIRSGDDMLGDGDINTGGGDIKIVGW